MPIRAGSRERRLPAKLMLPLVFGVSCVCVAAVLSAPPQKLSGQNHLPPLLPRTEVVSVLGAPFLHLVTDYYWIQTIQAVGKAATREQFRDIYDYANLVSDLDPRLRQVYVFAGAALPAAQKDGTWANTKESTKILEKGLREFPDLVFLRILLAYNYSTFEKDYRKAARILEEASKLPGAPEYLGPLSTRLYGAAGDFDTALALTQSLMNEAEDPETREAFEFRQRELMLERELRRVDSASGAFRQRNGRLPSTVGELVQSGDLDRIPNDPFGGDIILGSDGRSYSTASEERFGLHRTTSGGASP